MNKYNIDQHVFFTQKDVSQPKENRIAMGKVLKIEKISIDGGRSDILYTVKFICEVNYKRTERIKGPIVLSEGCLELSYTALLCLTEKTNR